MELFVAVSPFLCLIFVIPIGVAIVAVVFGFLNQENKAQKISWQTLAVTHNLLFNPGKRFLGSGAGVSGIYQGYFLKLGTIERSSGRSSATYTRITVTVPPPGDNLANEAPRPPLSFQEALDCLNLPDLRYKWSAEISAEAQGHHIYYEQRDVLTDIEYLEYLFDLLISLAEAYPVILTLGGEAVPVLQDAGQNRILSPFIKSLLLDIARDTTERLGYRSSHLLCPECLTFFAARRVNLSWWSSCTYYGCRTCGQSRDFYKGLVTAVIDSQMPVSPLQHRDTVQVNWLARRQLFDFDTVEIIQANDEEVERFAMQVGNDTDEIREGRYKAMQCLVYPQCQLSENSLRILRRMFGQVVIGQGDGPTAGLPRHVPA